MRSLWFKKFLIEKIIAPHVYCVELRARTYHISSSAVKLWILSESIFYTEFHVTVEYELHFNIWAVIF